MHGSAPASPRNDADSAADYSAAAGKITQTTQSSSRLGPRRAVILRFSGDGPFCASCGAGARGPLHADLTDRDRDESSRRAISAWVRTNPQTQVRWGARPTCPILLSPKREGGEHARTQSGG